MRLRRLSILLSIIAAGAFILVAGETKSKAGWSMNGTIIEACTCPMFCQCYFNPEPAAHSSHGGHGSHDATHYCKFNNAFHVNRGHYGDTKLDGAKFWVAGDLGGDFSMGKMDWAVLTFDPAVTPPQREGIIAALGKLYPVQWKSFTVADDAPVEWEATKQSAVARLDAGKAAEVILTKGPGMDDASPVVRNLRYWGAPSNEGFVLMPNKVQAYRLGEKAFESKGTNGFMITFDIASQ